MAAVWKHSRSKGAARLVLLALADEAASDGQVTAYARSQSALARKANTDVRTVRRAVDDLVELGEVVVLRHGDGQHPTDYRLVLPGLREGEGDTSAPKTSKGGQPARGREDTTPAQGGQDARGGEGDMSAPIEEARSVPVDPVVPAAPSRDDDACARAAWERRRDSGRPFAQRYVAIRAVAKALLRAYSAPLVIEALVHAPTPSVGACEVWLASAPGTAARRRLQQAQPATDRWQGVESGRVVL